MRRVSLAELDNAGVTLHTDESVAITQLLIQTPRDAHEPGGPAEYAPSSDNVFLNADGSVWWRGGQTTLSVAAAGNFLHTLLPSGSPDVPADLRHTIACALLTVHVPGISALDRFSRDLTRFERGDRAEAVRRVLARAEGDRPIRPLPPLNPRSYTAALTRTLPRRQTAAMAAVACLTAGVALIGNGASPDRAAAVAPPPIARSTSAPSQPAQLIPADAAVPVHETPPGMPHQRRPRRPAPRATRPAPVRLIASPPPPKSRSMLDRLHLGWLRARIGVRDNL